MLLYPSLQESVAWLEASDEEWGRRGAVLYADAVKRGQDGDDAGTQEDPAT